jgi:hypothetical protein
LCCVDDGREEVLPLGSTTAQQNNSKKSGKNPEDRLIPSDCVARMIGVEAVVNGAI